MKKVELFDIKMMDFVEIVFMCTVMFGYIDLIARLKECKVLLRMEPTPSSWYRRASSDKGILS